MFLQTTEDDFSHTRPKRGNLPAKLLTNAK
jgi:hypothetical protein